MKAWNVWTLGAAAALFALPHPGLAQISVTPTFGAYIPGGSFKDLQTAAEEKYERGATLGLGLNVTLGSLRGSVAYATGATISRDGINGSTDVGDGSVLAAALDLIWRPVKVALVQPYALGGLGYKRETYSFDEEGLPDDLTDDANKFVGHVGVGADISLGPLGLVVEVTDFIGRDNNDKWKVHDAFAVIGLKFGL